MVLEKFVPNEYVAGCVHPNVTEISGQMCFDLNGNGEFDWDPDERGYLSYPLGIYADSFYEGNFEIQEQGPYMYKMIIRLYPKGGLKGQQAHSPRQRLGCQDVHSRPVGA